MVKVTRISSCSEFPNWSHPHPLYASEKKQIISQSRQVQFWGIYFVFPRPLLPCGTVWEASAHFTHCQSLTSQRHNQRFATRECRVNFAILLLRNATYSCKQSSYYCLKRSFVHKECIT